MKIEKFEDIKAWKEARKLLRLVYKAIESNKNNFSYARSARSPFSLKNENYIRSRNRHHDGYLKGKRHRRE